MFDAFVFVQRRGTEFRGYPSDKGCIGGDAGE